MKSDDDYLKIKTDVIRNLLGEVVEEADLRHLPDVLWRSTRERLQQMGNMGGAYVKLAQVASFFTPDGEVGVHLLRRLWNTVVAPDVTDESVFNQAVVTLSRYNVFQTNNPIRMHRLDCSVIRQSALSEHADIETKIAESLAADERVN